MEEDGRFQSAGKKRCKFAPEFFSVKISVRSDYFFSPLVYTSFICHGTDSMWLKPLPRAVELLDMVSAQKTH